MFAVGLTGLPAPAKAGPDDARQAAEQFVQALTTGKPEALQKILPRSGKILVAIRSTRQTAGNFSRSQVEVIFNRYLSEFSFRDCRIDHIEVQESSYSRIDLTANRSGPGDTLAPVLFRLAMQSEEGHWVLREIRESSP